MAYKAYLNGTELFFDSTLQDESFFLSYAVLDMEANTSGDFTFRIPSTHPSYNSFHRMSDYVDVYRDDDIIFSGRVYSITEETDTQRLISCEGLLAILHDSIFRPITFDGTLRNLVRAIIASHNSQVEASKQIAEGTLTITDSEVYRDYQNYETNISRLQDLVSSFGGYVFLRKTNSGYALDWLSDFTDACDQVIELCSNLITITEEENSDNLITVLVPVGATKDDGSFVTIESVNGGHDYIVASSTYTDQYGYIVGTRRWEDVNVPQILKTKAQNYLTALLQPRVTIELTAADLADAGYDVEAFRIGQKITVKSDPHGIDNVQFDCQHQLLNLLYPEQNRLTLGEIRPGYVQSLRIGTAELSRYIDQIAAGYTPKTMLQTAIESATSLITGNDGGYVVMHDSDADTYPDEILVMDSPDIDTAVKVWRFNNSGLGYSSTGYSGTYGLALTMDGAIVADRITTGTLNADLLRGGIIRGQQGDSYWNLVTGELHIGGSGNVDKSKVFITTPTPPYYYGDLWITERSETSGVAGYAVAGYAIAGDESSGEGGKIMACTYTRTSGSFNPDDWHLVTNYVDTSELQVLEQRVDSAELNIIQNRAEIQLKASTEYVDAFGDRVSACEAEIDVFSDEISMMVTDEDITGNYVVGKINLTSTTATIAASHIDLQGAVTISDLNSTAKAALVSSSTAKVQYYLSTSTTSTIGGSWSDTIPTWTSGKYIWTRIATTKTNVDGTTETTYSPAVYDSNLSTACSKSSSSYATIADWCYSNNLTYIDGSKLYTGTVSAVKIAVGAVTEEKLASSAVTSGKIASSAVTSAKIADGAITSGKIGSGAVTEVKLSNGSVTVDKIGAGAVTTVKLSDGSVTTAKIPSYAITGVKIADNAITARCITANAVTANAIAANAITTDKLAANAVTAAKISAGAITTDKLAATAVTAAKIDTTDLFSQNLTATNFHLEGGDINLSTSTETEDKIFLSYDRYESAVSRNVRFTNKMQPKGFTLYNNLLRTSPQDDNLGTISYYQAHRLSFFVNTYEDIPVVNFGVAYGNSTGYRGFLQIYRGRATQLLVEVCEGVTSCGWVGVHDSGGATTAYLAGDGGYCAAYHWTTLSDRRVKTDISCLDIDESARLIYSLKPSRFRFKSNDALVHHGFIAQEVEETINDDDWGIVTETLTNQAGSPNSDEPTYKTLEYSELIADLVATAQKHHEEIEMLKAKLEA